MSVSSTSQTQKSAPAQSVGSTDRASGAGATPKTVKYGDRGPAVEQLQREMKAKGAYDGPVTGYFGKLTQAAVQTYQKRNNLEQDGIVGPKTWGSLLGAKPGSGTPSTGHTSGSDFDPGTKPSKDGIFPPPVGYKAMVERFGKPGENIVTAKLPLGPGGKEIDVQLNAKMVPIMKSVLAEAKEKGLLKYINKFDGMAVAPRLKRHPDGTPLKPPQYSVHSWGVAFDINADAKGGQVNKELVNFLKSKGFAWGGDFKSNYDPMHFQYVKGY